MITWERRWRSHPGAHPVPAPGPSPHWTGGEEFRTPLCPGCGQRIRQFFVIDVREIESLRLRLAMWKTIPLLACPRCRAWTGRHDYDVDRRTLAVALADADVQPSAAVLPAPPLVKRYVALSWVHPPGADPKLARPQIAGEPWWLREPVSALCRDCRRLMVFVAALAGDPTLDIHPVAFARGRLYHFACDVCARLSVIPQWSCDNVCA